MQELLTRVSLSSSLGNAATLGAISFARAGLVSSCTLHLLYSFALRLSPPLHSLLACPSASSSVSSPLTCCFSKLATTC